MKKDKLKIYLFSLSLLIILFLALFVSNSFSKKTLAIILVFFAFLSKVLVKKKNKISLYDKEVTWLMAGFTFIYIVILYLLGLYFGYYKATFRFNVSTIFNYIMPMAIIIITSEILRNILLQILSIMLLLFLNVLILLFFFLL